MKKAAILAAPGFEEIELMAPLDILRRLNFDVQLAGVQSDKVVSTHDVTVTTTSASFFSAAPSRRENILRSTRSSGSTKPTYFPSAASSPAFRAADTPALDWLITRRRLSFSRHLYRSSSVPSVEPSSTQMISMGPSVCSARPDMHSST